MEKPTKPIAIITYSGMSNFIIKLLVNKRTLLKNVDITIKSYDYIDIQKVINGIKAGKKELDVYIVGFKKLKLENFQNTTTKIEFHKNMIPFGVNLLKPSLNKLQKTHLKMLSEYFDKNIISLDALKLLGLYNMHQDSPNHTIKQYFRDVFGKLEKSSLTLEYNYIKKAMYPFDEHLLFYVDSLKEIDLGGYKLLIADSSIGINQHYILEYFSENEFPVTNYLLYWNNKLYCFNNEGLESVFKKYIISINKKYPYGIPELGSKQDVNSIIKSILKRVKSV